MTETKKLIALMSSYYGTESKLSNGGEASKRFFLTSEVISAFNEVGELYPQAVSDDKFKRVIVELLEREFADYINVEQEPSFARHIFARLSMVLAAQGFGSTTHYISAAKGVFGSGIKFKDHGNDEVFTPELIDQFSVALGLSNDWLENGGAPSMPLPPNVMVNMPIVEMQQYYSGFVREADFFVLRAEDPQKNTRYFVFQVLSLSERQDSRVLFKAINPITYIDSDEFMDVLSESLKIALGDLQAIKGQVVPFGLLSELVLGQRLIWMTNVIDTSTKIKREDVAGLLKTGVAATALQALTEKKTTVDAIEKSI